MPRQTKARPVLCSLSFNGAQQSLAERGQLRPPRGLTGAETDGKREGPRFAPEAFDLQLSWAELTGGDGAGNDSLGPKGREGHRLSGSSSPPA